MVYHVSMSIFKRSLVEQLVSRLSEQPKHIQIIGGPRQTGKTTLVRQACEEIYEKTKRANHFCAVDKPTGRSNIIVHHAGYEDQIIAPDKPDVEWLVHQWEKARAKTRSEGCKATGHILVLDEIQKIPNWSEAVKGLWDEDHSEGLNLHIVLLGSSPLLMQRGISESLLGRYEILESRHWSFIEMAQAFNFTVDEYIYFGGYPGAASYIKDELRWKGYVQNSLINPYLQMDIMAMARIDKPALLKSTFELSCEYSGQIFSYTKMLGQLNDAGNTTTIAHYMDLLSKAGLVTGISAYSGNKRKKRASKPKLNVMNTGLMACYSDYTFRQAMADRTYWGRIVESSVGAHILNTINNSSKIYYWRVRGNEVDFIVEKNKKLLAIEVKSGNKAKNLKGLKKFVEEYENTKALLVGAEGIGLQEFLSYPIDHWFD